jgi:tight adherence protein C
VALKVSNAELASMLMFLGIFLAIIALHFSLFYGVFRSQKRAISRLKNLSGNKTEEEAKFGEWLRDTLPKIGTLIMPKEEDNQLVELKADMLRAGIYNRNALRIFLGGKLLLMLFLPIPLALAPFCLGLITLLQAEIASLLATSIGMSLPLVWLRQRVRSRQRSLRRAVPDVLDMMVLCLEGGVSLSAAVQRVMVELQVIHPVLAGELGIIHREVQMGLTVGEGLRAFAERCNLEEVRDLASVLIQSERIGASVAQALRTHAESSRLERQQRAEEVAHKTSVKIIFPTLLCIFPDIFIVLIGPAAIQISELFK